MKLAVIGLGNIGRGFMSVLREKQGFLAKKYNLGFSVVAVCEKDGCIVSDKGIDLKSVLKVPMKKHPSWTGRKTLDVLSSSAADIALEFTPGNMKTGEPGFSHIMKALGCGMDVVTSNKAPLALAFREIMDYAKRKDSEVRYEATVGGAIPLINLYRSTLQANEIRNIYGILNGTTNFILSKMSEESVSFDTALREALELGIAESNYRYDVDGVDTAVKVVILANAIMGKDISFSDVAVTGMREVTAETIELAKKHGSEIKLVGDVSQLEVSPRLIPQWHPLNISGVLNAVMLETDVAGDITLTGVGAGPRETVSSILSDVIELGLKRQA